MSGFTDKVVIITGAAGVIGKAVVRRLADEVASLPACNTYKNTVPLKRYGEPEEVADAITFLLSDEASYVGSSSYKVDAGVFNI